TEADRSEVAELIYASINTWYQLRGLPAIFHGGPEVTDVFYEVYSGISPGCCVVAEHPQTGRLMGCCFYHPRESHFGLGIMTVHPNHFGRGVGGKLLSWILAEADRRGAPAVRLTQSALNVDSFSLYTRAGFVPRAAFQDMLLPVPEDGLHVDLPGCDRVRPGTVNDIPAMVRLEQDVSGISRTQDFTYCLENQLGFWSTLVLEGAAGELDGFLISSGHAAVNILGPGVTRTEEDAAALLVRSLDLHRGRTPVFLVPVDRAGLVRQMYDIGARNCEMHFCQVRGKFQQFNGISLPSFLPETG
ncbi:MAG: GNAT family N-acetyltransferase, partial [Planctomycetaceae bacterium]|nr:GNAT family N-acetyltransferase [Planctomycetaceae bacterium]